jgi:hypothetical protein
MQSFIVVAVARRKGILITSDKSILALSCSEIVAMLTFCSGKTSLFCVTLALAALPFAADRSSELIASGPPATKQPAGTPLDANPKPIKHDASVKYDYDIVYVRAPRKGDNQQIL